jgi:hypothetical protein
MRQYRVLLLLITTPLNPMVSTLWNLKSFVSKVQPAKDHLVTVTQAEMKRLTSVKQDIKEVLSATNKILQASIPIIQETGNFTQSKQLKELLKNLKQLRTIITDCTTDTTT